MKRRPGSWSSRWLEGLGICSYIFVVTRLWGRCVEFEWDENKNRINKAKHGISFQTAREVFRDPYALIDQDRHVGGEERWQAIGLINGIRVVVVAHTYPGYDHGKEIVRIISARSATAVERQAYDRARLGPP